MSMQLGREDSLDGDERFVGHAPRGGDALGVGPGPVSLAG